MKHLSKGHTWIAAGLVLSTGTSCAATRTEGLSETAESSSSSTSSLAPAPGSVSATPTAESSTGVEVDRDSSSAAQVPLNDSSDLVALTSEPRSVTDEPSDTSSSSSAVSELPATSSVADSASSSLATDVQAGVCRPSTKVEARASGTGPHEVVVETNPDSGIKEGTIFRPADMGGAEKYPVFVWGQGGCSKDGLSNAAAMAEIASHGYFVVADGTPNGDGNRTMDRSNLAAMGAPLVAYIDWAIAENEKPCSAYYQGLDTSKIASNGFSCGGLMSQATVLDSRIVTWGVNSSGMAGATDDFYSAITTPVLFVEGGPDDVAYDGGLEGYNRISELGVPVMWFDKALGHGGDLFQANGGDFTKINLAWLNWWLKGDEGATGKGALVGDDCAYCSDSQWDVRANHLP